MPPTKPPHTLADATPPRDLSAPEQSSRAPESDPLRQLFRRHANHFSGLRARQIHNRLRDRLFRELPGDPDSP
jgi:hypothetical protein